MTAYEWPHWIPGQQKAYQFGEGELQILFSVFVLFCILFYLQSVLLTRMIEEPLSHYSMKLHQFIKDSSHVSGVLLNILALHKFRVPNFLG